MEHRANAASFAKKSASFPYDEAVFWWKQFDICIAEPGPTCVFHSASTLPFNSSSSANNVNVAKTGRIDDFWVLTQSNQNKASLRIFKHYGARSYELASFMFKHEITSFIERYNISNLGTRFHHSASHVPLNSLSSVTLTTRQP